MPVIKSAIKKLRQDKKRGKENQAIKIKADMAVRNAKKKATGKAVSEAISMVDKLAKKNIIHQNKASRIKASLSKIAKPVSAKGRIKQKEGKTTKTSKKTSQKTTK